MQNSRCYRLIQRFSDRELKKAEQFLASPYFNSSKTLLKLFRYSKKYKNNPDHPKFSKVQTFRHLYGNVPYNENNLRTNLSRLTKLLREFLVIQELKEEDGISSQLLIKSYSKKAPYLVFEREIEERIKTIKEKPVRDTGFYRELLWLNRELFFHPDTQRTEKGRTIISEIMSCLDLFFMLSKLEYSSELFTRQVILSEEHKIHFLEKVIDLGLGDLAGQNNLIDLYIRVIQLQRDGLEEALLQKCIDDFLNHAHLMNKFDKTQLLHNLINLTLTALNAGKRVFLPHVVRMYKIAVNNNLMLDKGKIAYTTFLNVTILGPAAAEFSWTRDFIEKFSFHIDENYRDDATKMAWAFWYYQKGNHEDNSVHYEKAIDYLSLIPFTSIPINLRIRTLLLRIYYDYFFMKKNDANVLLDHLEAFDKYIIRNTAISDARAEGYHNLIRITRKTVRLKGKKSYAVKKVQQLKKEIEQAEKLVLKLWLLEKAEEL